ncbi:MAG: hypothetical protein ACFHX7_11960 [Pseudomonadota bacterium]
MAHYTATGNPRTFSSIRFYSPVPPMLCPRARSKRHVLLQKRRLAINPV